MHWITIGIGVVILSLFATLSGAGAHNLRSLCFLRFRATSLALRVLPRFPWLRRARHHRKTTG